MIEKIQDFVYAHPYLCGGIVGATIVIVHELMLKYFY
jgi:hypothetical protein